MRMARSCPDFAPLVEGNCVDPEPLEQPLAEELRQLTNPKQWLMALHLTCTYLAAKNVDKVGRRPKCTCIRKHVAFMYHLTAPTWPPRRWTRWGNAQSA